MNATSRKERHKQTDRWTDRQADRQIDKKVERHQQTGSGQRKTIKERQTPADRLTDIACSFKK